MKEPQLISQAKKGDSEAFGALYDKYMPAIYRFVRVKVGTKSDAEDITHQVFLKAWKNLRKYKEKGHPFSSWLYRIAQNSVIDFYRSSRSHRDIDTLPEETLSEDTNVEGRLDQLFEVRFVHQKMKELDETSRNVLLMKFVNDLSNKEIAVALEKTEGAIRVIQHRALKQLRNVIKEHDKRRDNQTTTEV